MFDSILIVGSKTAKSIVTQRYIIVKYNMLRYDWTSSMLHTFF